MYKTMRKILVISHRFHRNLSLSFFYPGNS